MLPLDSPRWSKLQSAITNGVESAKELAQLKDSLAQSLSQTSDANFDQLLDQFCFIFDDLFCQNTTYPATNAAMPHFVEIAEKFPIAERVHALTLISLMHFDGAANQSVDPDIKEWYRTSISKAKDLNRSMLIGDEKLSFDEQISSLKSHYIFNGYYHYMFRDCDWFDYPCPKCKEQLYAKLVENEYWVWPEKTVIIWKRSRQRGNLKSFQQQTLMSQ